MLDNLKRGDRVQTIGGIIGTVVEARETEVVVKVDETNNTKIRFARKAITRVLEDDEACEVDVDGEVSDNGCHTVSRRGHLMPGN